MSDSSLACYAFVLISSVEFQPTFDFFNKKLSFRVKSIFPADNPFTATLIGYSIVIKIISNGQRDSSVLHIMCENFSDIVELPTNECSEMEQMDLLAPNGTRIILVKHRSEFVLPPLQEDLIISRREDKGQGWTVGRAGMRYRDLIPGRLGGRYIASHIHIPDAGPVPDYVHYHKVRFQIIYCYKGWVQVVYQDQGPPFVLKAGDCVVQPPEIRHRVLECGPDLEVVEIGCPAVHETISEFEITLPTDVIVTEKTYSGQRFVRHVSEDCDWVPVESWSATNMQWEGKLTGIGEATMAGEVITLRPVRVFSAGDMLRFVSHNVELLFLFVLSGHVDFVCRITSERSEFTVRRLDTTDSITIPTYAEFNFKCWSDDFQMLVVTSPAHSVLTPCV